MKQLVMYVFMLCCVMLNAQTYTPIADTYVRNGSYSTKNYGNASLMEVKESTISGNTRLAYLKFDLTGQQAAVITQVKLRIYISAGSSTSVAVHGVSSTWVENKLNWNNKPAEGAQIAVKTVTTSKIYHEWDVTSYIKTAIASGQTSLSLMVKDIANGSTLSLTSRNASTNRPQLVVVKQILPPTTIYINASTGNDANSGSSASSPWKNISKLHNLTLQPGTSVYLAAGSVWSGQQLKFRGSGTQAAPIRINRYGTGVKPRLNGNGMTGEGVVYLYNQEYIEIRNLEITNAPNGPNDADFFLSNNPLGGDRRGVMVAIDSFGTADHIYLKGLDIHHVKGMLGSGETAVNGAIPKRTGGIFFTVLGVRETTAAKSRFNDIVVDSCQVYYCENTGFAIDNEWNVFYPGGEFSSLASDRTEYQNWFDRRNTNLRISNSTFHHIGKNAIIVRMADWTGLIERNICYETALGTTGNTMFTARCKGTVFQYNEGYNNRATTQTVNPGNIDGSLYDADYGSVGIIFQYSYSHDNSEGLYWGCNTRGGANNTSGIPDPGDVGCTVRYNVSQNDKGDLIFFNYPSAGNEIYNNVFYIGPGVSPNIIHESSKQHTYSFRNNIIYNLSPTADYSLKLTGQTRNISHNIFYGYHPSGDATVAEPTDPFKITADPLFVAPGTGSGGLSSLNGYRLMAGSPAINAGMTITENGGKDFWGNTLYNGLPDRGAHEFAAAVLPVYFGRNETQIMQPELYPNPVNSSFTLRFDSTAGHAGIRITDTAGRIVRAYSGVDSGSTFSVDDLQRGVYFVIITNREGHSMGSMVMVKE